MSSWHTSQLTYALGIGGMLSFYGVVSVIVMMLPASTASYNEKIVIIALVLLTLPFALLIMFFARRRAKKREAAASASAAEPAAALAAGSSSFTAGAGWRVSGNRKRHRRGRLVSKNVESCFRRQRRPLFASLVSRRGTAAFGENLSAYRSGTRRKNPSEPARKRTANRPSDSRG
jgi:hypothetical protein